MNLRERFEKDMDMDSKFEIAGMDCPTWGYVAYLESLLEWIPVDKDLPKVGDAGVYASRPVLTTDEKEIYICVFVKTAKTEWWQNVETQEKMIGITHWLPLPPLPEVKE
jgi:hypothetical protein